MAVKKSIAIIGEGETEWWYFETLRIACRYKFKVAPDFPQHSDIPHMAKLAENYVKRETDHVVCLVDMDRLFTHPKEMASYLDIKKKSSRKIVWIETSPCTEFWFLLHFLPQLAVKHYKSYEDCCPNFSITCRGTRRRSVTLRKTICTVSLQRMAIYNGPSVMPQNCHASVKLYPKTRLPTARCIKSSNS